MILATVALKDEYPNINDGEYFLGLALMGPSHWAFLREAHRVLRSDGELRVTEVKSRFDQGRKRVIQRRFNVSVPRARVPKTSTYASRPFREMIARPKISQNEWKTAEI